MRATALGIMAEQPGVDGESDTVGAAWKLRAMAFRDMIIYFRNHPSIRGLGRRQPKGHPRPREELRGHGRTTYDPHGGRAYAHRRAAESAVTTAEFMDVGIGTEGGREIGRLPVVEGEIRPRRIAAPRVGQLFAAQLRATLLLASPTSSPPSNTP